MSTQLIMVHQLLKQTLRAIAKLPPKLKISYDVTVAAILLQLREDGDPDYNPPNGLQNQESVRKIQKQPGRPLSRAGEVTTRR